jgi:hypothetical protein
MNTVISQPMLFPWVGMLEQVRLADTYVHYLDVQFSKGSFVNRVQLKTERGSQWMTVPLENLRLGQRIDEVKVSQKQDWRQAHTDQLRAAYDATPHRDDMLALVDSVYCREYPSIGELSRASLMAVCAYFGLTDARTFMDSPQIGVAGSGSQRVLDIVLASGASVYITGHGASRYLDHELFERAGIRVEYMEYARTPYAQAHGEFTPYVSTLDLIANCGRNGAQYIHSGSIYWKDFLRDRPDCKVSS